MDNGSTEIKIAEIKTRLRAILAAYIQQGAREEDIPDSADLRNYGLDSIDTLEFFAEINHQFNIKLRPEEIDLAEHNSIECIARLIAQSTQVL